MCECVDGWMDHGHGFGPATHEWMDGSWHGFGPEGQMFPFLHAFGVGSLCVQTHACIFCAHVNACL